MRSVSRAKDVIPIIPWIGVLQEQIIGEIKKTVPILNQAKGSFNLNPEDVQGRMLPLT